MPVAWPCNVFKQKHSSWVLLKTKSISILKQKPQLCDLKRNAYLVEDHQIFFAHFLEPCCIQSSPSGPVRQPHSGNYSWFCHIHSLQLYFPHAYLQQLQKNITDTSGQVSLSCCLYTETTKARKNRTHATFSYLMWLYLA